jgi:ribose/xylose/arabinose/galactoside ABC-type transport system permease subunit
VKLELPWPVGVIAAITCGIVVGLANGLVTTLIGVPSFIATGGVLLLLWFTLRFIRLGPAPLRSRRQQRRGR